jgi:hypothetical protein
MTGFYNLIDTLKEELKSIPFVNTVTYGDISDVDLNKQTIFPLTHFIVNNFNYQSNIVVFNISLLCMDIIDESKSDVTDVFVGNNNEQDIFNTQMNVIVRVLDKLKRGDLYSEKYQLEGQPSVEAFTDRFENKLAGWSCSFDVAIANDMSIC